MRPLFFFFLVFGIFGPKLEAQEVSNMINPQVERLLSSEDFPDRKQAVWSVDKTILQDGMQAGVELITIDNGHMKIVIVPTRGMSIYRVSSDATSLGWNSPVKQIVHPQFVDLNDHGGLGWLAGFNEMMVRCGVEFAGHPGEDDGKMLTLHGRIGNIPATQVEVSVDDQAPHRIRVRGTVEEKRFKFGVFDLETEISTLPGSREFSVKDRLVNRSEYAKEYQMIYHSNFGRPILQAGAKFLAPVASVAPFDEYAAKDLDTFPLYLGPTKGYGEQVYCMQLYADERDRTAVALINEEASQGVCLSYDTSTLPFFTLWKNTDTETDGYVTGLEPGTGYPFNRSVEREEGRVPQLEPGGDVTFQLNFELLENAKDVESARLAIEKITGNKKATVHDQPPRKVK